MLLPGESSRPQNAPMRTLVAVAVGLSILGFSGPSRAMLTIASNASFLSVDSGAPVLVSYGPASLTGTSGTSSLSVYPAPDGPMPTLYGQGQIASNGGAVDADSVFDIHFTSDHLQSFAVYGTSVSPTVTAFFTSSDGFSNQTFQGNFLYGGFLRPGVEYEFFAGLTDAVGGFTVVLLTPEPSLALLALAALVLAAGYRLTRMRASTAPPLPGRGSPRVAR
jgi:hypothetical protein